MYVTHHPIASFHAIGLKYVDIRSARTQVITQDDSSEANFMQRHVIYTVDRQSPCHVPRESGQNGSTV